MSAIYKCPSGHILPSVINGITCSAIFCAKDSQKPVTYNPVKHKPNPSHFKPTPLLDVPDDATEEERASLLGIQDAVKHNQRISQARLRSRRVAIHYEAKERDSNEAEGYVTEKLIKLTPDALAELEYQLLHGDDKSRKEIALEVLDRTGHGKKDLGYGSQAPIVLIQNAGFLPWMNIPGAVGAGISSPSLSQPSVKEIATTSQTISSESQSGHIVESGHIPRRLATLDGDSGTGKKSVDTTDDSERKYTIDDSIETLEQIEKKKNEK